jgi:PE-PPE domain/PE family
MTSLVTQPQLMATAATDAAQINSAISAARAAAAGPTTSLVAAAQDEVSAMTATLFGAYGQEYQAILQQASAFHEQFVAALAAAGNAYTEAEAANATAISGALGAVTSPMRSMLGGSTGAAGGGSAVTGAVNMVKAAAADPTFTVVIGGSGNPIPVQPYINDVVDRFITNSFGGLLPNLTPGTVQGLFTPEGLYPLLGVKELTLNQSLMEGVQILNTTLVGQNGDVPGLLLTTGNHVNVLGYSQSAIIASMEEQMLNPTNTGMAGSPFFSQLNFSLIGDVANPNGGLLSRFPGLSLPSIGVTFGTSTPDNSFMTTIVTQEYDGFADFPQYPINVLSDINAFAGIAFVHGTYPTLTPQQISTEIPLTNTVGTTTDQYFIIPTPNLPILDPLRLIPVVGNPLADLVQPDLTVLVNTGYGSTTQGWSTGAPNVPTPFGVIPPVGPITVANALVNAAPQGFSAFMNDVSAEAPVMASNLSPAGLSSALMGTGGVGAASGLTAQLTSALSSPDNFIQAIQTANTTITNEISNAAANTYATLLPTADIANALVTSVPSYDVNLFLSGVQQAIGGDPVGGLVYAFGAPVAADAGLGTFAAGVELAVLLGATGYSI